MSLTSITNYFVDGFPTEAVCWGYNSGIGAVSRTGKQQLKWTLLAADASKESIQLMKMFLNIIDPKERSIYTWIRVNQVDASTGLNVGVHPGARGFAHLRGDNVVDAKNGSDDTITIDVIFEGSLPVTDLKNPYSLIAFEAKFALASQYQGQSFPDVFEILMFQEARKHLEKMEINAPKMLNVGQQTQSEVSQQGIQAMTDQSVSGGANTIDDAEQLKKLLQDPVGTSTFEAVASRDRKQSQFEDKVTGMLDYHLMETEEQLMAELKELEKMKQGSKGYGGSVGGSFVPVSSVGDNNAHFTKGQPSTLTQPANQYISNNTNYFMGDMASGTLGDPIQTANRINPMANQNVQAAVSGSSSMKVSAYNNFNLASVSKPLMSAVTDSTPSYMPMGLTSAVSDMHTLQAGNQKQLNSVAVYAPSKASIQSVQQNSDPKASHKLSLENLTRHNALNGKQDRPYKNNFPGTRTNIHSGLGCSPAIGQKNYRISSLGTSSIYKPLDRRAVAASRKNGRTTWSTSESENAPGDLVDNVFNMSLSDIERVYPEKLYGNRKNIIINYLPALVVEKDLRKLFVQFGSIRHVKVVRWSTGVSKEFAFIKYQRASSCFKAIQACNGLQLENKTIKVSLARKHSQSLSNANVIVKNLRKGTDAAYLKEIFERYGNIVECRMLRKYGTVKPRGRSKNGAEKVGGSAAIVRFDCSKNAMASVNDLANLKEILGVKRLEVKYMHKRDAVSRRLAKPIKKGKK